MAHVINRFVLRGRFDNRERGVVKVRLWFAGMKGPVQFKLEGDFHHDMAGICLVFANKANNIVRAPEVFSVLQQNHYEGQVGDMTMDKNVWVPSISEEGRLESKVARRISLEWFLPEWGRFLLETESLKVRMSMPEWEMDSCEAAVQLMENKMRLRDYISAVKDTLWNLSPGEELLPWYSSKLMRKQQQYTEILNSLQAELEAKYALGNEDYSVECEIAFAMSWNHILEAAAFNEETGDQYFESAFEEDLWSNPEYIDEILEENEQSASGIEPIFDELETLANQIHEWLKSYKLERNKDCPVYRLLSEYSFIMDKVPLVISRMRRGEPDPERLLEPLRKARLSFKKASQAFSHIAVPTRKLLHMSIMQRWNDLGRNMDMLYESIRHRG